jgi:hypothetical protein
MAGERQQQAGAPGVEEGQQVEGSPCGELVQDEEPVTWLRNRAGRLCDSSRAAANLGLGGERMTRRNRIWPRRRPSWTEAGDQGGGGRGASVTDMVARVAQDGVTLDPAN